MNHHDGPSVAVEKRMAEGQISHNLARSGGHAVSVRSHRQSVLDGRFSIRRVCKQNATSAHGDLGCGLCPVLPGPRVNIAEQNFMRKQNIVVGKSSNGPEIFERLGNPGDERTALSRNL